MIDHVSIAVSSLSRSASFYDHVLEPLGLERIVTREATVGYGKTYPEFWLNARPDLEPVEKTTGSHVCLRAPRKEAVIAFYRAALELGGSSGGVPGEREGAVTRYFGAFIHDPDGNKVEAVTFPRSETR
ncbi:VOC family protein [Afifella pfennigii]|uniref:VOC family protein n=1 Tax=Afifella pfennigii TaxID=209897 RepID=UPI00047A6525|nr:VOC family protein [Afifella pfennigii]